MDEPVLKGTGIFVFLLLFLLNQSYTELGWLSLKRGGKKRKRQTLEINFKGHIFLLSFFNYMYNYWSE